MTFEQYLRTRGTFRPDPRLIDTAKEFFEAGQRHPIDRELYQGDARRHFICVCPDCIPPRKPVYKDASPKLVAALRALHAVCAGMDAECDLGNEDGKPTEQDYQDAMAAAAEVLADARFHEDLRTQNDPRATTEQRTAAAARAQAHIDAHAQRVMDSMRTGAHALASIAKEEQGRAAS